MRVELAMSQSRVMVGVVVDFATDACYQRRLERVAHRSITKTASNSKV